MRAGIRAFQSSVAYWPPELAKNHASHQRFSRILERRLTAPVSPCLADSDPPTPVVDHRRMQRIDALRKRFSDRWKRQEPADPTFDE